MMKLTFGQSVIRLFVLCAISQHAAFLTGVSANLIAVATITCSFENRFQAASEPDDSEKSEAQRDIVEKVKTLVAQLGDDDFAVRQDAAQKLTDIGMPAVEVLRDYKTAADSEIRFSVSRILKKIVRSDFQSRLDSFLNATSEDQSDYGLPGWTEFSKRVGKTKIARQAFVEIQRLHPKTMAAFKSDAESISTEFRSLLTDMSINSRRYSNMVRLESCILCFFLASLEKHNDKEITRPQNEDTNIGNLFSNHLVANNLREGKYKKILRSFLIEWIEKGLEGDLSVDTRFRLVDQHQIKEGIPIALKLLRRQASVSYYRQQAIWFLAKIDGKKYHDEIESMLEDKTTLTQRNMKINGKDVRMVTQLRDVALSALLYIHQQNYREYGFEQASKSLSAPLSYSLAGFRNDEARTKAMEKWKEFKKTLD